MAPGKVAQAVLAHLALAGGRTMSVRGLSADVWEDPPDSARNAVQVAVSKLRRAYGADLVLSDQTGYRLGTSGLRIDLNDFDSLVERARDHLAAQRPADAMACLVDAETLIVGEPLAGLESAASESARRRIEDRGSAHDCSEVARCSNWDEPVRPCCSFRTRSPATASPSRLTRF